MQTISSPRSEGTVAARQPIVADLEKDFYPTRKQEGYQVLVTVISFQRGFSEISGLLCMPGRKPLSPGSAAGA